MSNNFSYPWQYLTGSKLSWNLGGWGYISDSVRLTSGPLVVKEGSDNEDFAARIGRGEFVGSDYYRSFVDGSAVVKGSSSWLQWEQDWTSYGVDFVSYVTTFPPLPDLSQFVVDQALLNYWAKLRSLTATWEVLASAAELRSTVAGIVSRYSSLRKYVKSGVRKALSKTGRLSRGRGSKAYKRESISGVWLEFHLGLKPLLMDFEDAASSFCDRPNPYLVHVVGKAQNQVRMRDEIVDFSPNGWDIFNLSCTTEAREFYRVQGFFDVETINSYSQRGFDPTGAVMALWEVVPLSFVIDYFAQIDAFLLGPLQMALQPTNAVFTSGVTRTRRYRSLPFSVKQDSVPGNVRSPSGYSVPTSSEVTDGYVSRSVSDKGIGLPSSLVFKSWNSLHWSQQATCGALLTQASKRLRTMTWFL